MSFLTVLLNSTHKKSAFVCGNPLLDLYLHKQARQDVKRHLSACFVIADTNHEILRYYTLSNACINRELIPENIKNKLPSACPDLPVTLLGRLARSKKHIGERLGEKLLLDALKRCYLASSVVGSMAVIVDPVDENSIKFYLKYGFIALPDSNKMFLTMKTIAELFQE